jgi:hypothetical protein
MAGVVSIGDFAMRPAVPSIIRIIYPHDCRSRVSGAMRQDGSIALLGAILSSATLLSMSSPGAIHLMIGLEITFAGLACVAAFLCFLKLPDLSDGSVAEADAVDDPSASFVRATLTPLRDKRFRRYLAAVFVFSFANLFHQGYRYGARRWRIGTRRYSCGSDRTGLAPERGPTNPGLAR